MADPAALQAMLGGLGPGGPPPSGPPGPDPSMMGGPPDQGGGEDDPISILQQMLDLADNYGQVEPDDEDKLLMEKARTLLQQLLAKDQKDQDGLMQGKLSPSAMRKAAPPAGGY
jgi:hypothetical protein